MHTGPDVGTGALSLNAIKARREMQAAAVKSA